MISYYIFRYEINFGVQSCFKMCKLFPLGAFFYQQLDEFLSFAIKQKQNKTKK